MKARRLIILAPLLWVGLAGSPSLGQGGPARPEPYAVAASVCDVKNAEITGPRKARVVLITAQLGYAFEAGYSLQDPTCHDRTDGTGVIPISAPRGGSIRDFPRISEISTQDYMKAHRAPPICACLGRVSYPGGYARFELIHAEVRP